MINMPNAMDRPKKIMCDQCTDTLGKIFSFGINNFKINTLE